MDEKELKSPANVGITISTEDAVIEGAELCVIRDARIVVHDAERGYSEATVILQTNDQQDYVVTVPQHRLGRLIQAASAQDFSQLPGRLIYAGDLTNTKPVLVSPFTFAAVRGELVPQPEADNAASS